MGSGFDRKSSPFSCMSSAQRQQLLEENPEYFPDDTLLICPHHGHWGDAGVLPNTHCRLCSAGRTLNLPLALLSQGSRN